MKDYGIKGSKLKIVWVCGLAVWLAIAVHGRVATGPQVVDTRSEKAPASYGELPSNGPGFSRVAFLKPAQSSLSKATPQLKEDNVPAGLVIYLQLHETRDVLVDRQSHAAAACLDLRAGF
jgi:hypothetical protein